MFFNKGFVGLIKGIHSTPAIANIYNMYLIIFPAAQSVRTWFTIYPGRTEFEDKISAPGLALWRSSQAYREPRPSSRRRKDDPFVWRSPQGEKIQHGNYRCFQKVDVNKNYYIKKLQIVSACTWQTLTSYFWTCLM